MKGLLPLAIALLLPSCVFSNIGERIRDGGKIYTGVDISRPVDGKAYQTPAQQSKQDEAYIIAPEYTYVWREPFLCTHYLFHPGWPRGSRGGFRATGRQLPARVSLRNGQISYLLKQEENIPATAKPIAVQPGDDRDMHATRPATEPGTWRYIVAAPFAYVVDPVLPFPFSCFTFPGFMLYESFRQNQADPTPGAATIIPKPEPKTLTE